MPSKTVYKDFENSTITVIKSNEWQGFSVQRAQEIGLEKACILANIDDVREKNMKEIIAHFPYISPKRLQILITELVQEGHLVKGGDV